MSSSVMHRLSFMALIVMNLLLSALTTASAQSVEAPSIIRVGQAASVVITIPEPAESVRSFINFNNGRPEGSYIIINSDGTCGPIGPTRFGNDVTELVFGSCEYTLTMNGGAEVRYSIIFDEEFLGGAESLEDNLFAVLWVIDGRTSGWRRPIPPGSGFTVTRSEVPEEPQPGLYERALSCVEAERALVADEATNALTCNEASTLQGLGADAFQRPLNEFCGENQALSGFNRQGDPVCISIGEMPSSLPGYKFVTPENVDDVTIEDGDHVLLKGTFEISGRWRVLDRPNLIVSGGSFVGQDPTAEIDFGNNTIINGATFSGPLVIDGGELSFNKCGFRDGAFEFPFDSDITKGYMNGIIVSEQRELGVIDSVEIINSDIRRFQALVNSEIDDSIIGDRGQLISNNLIDDSWILLGVDKTRFTDNNCDNVLVEIPEDHSGNVNITDNDFEDPYMDSNEIILINAASSRIKSYKINDNNFRVNSSDPQSIHITGNIDPGPQNTILQINDNSFIKGTRAIRHDSNIYTLISGNITRDTTLGVTADSRRNVQGNAEFP